MLRNRTREILDERGETNYTLYQKIEQMCQDMGKPTPSYNTVLAFVRNNTETINKRVWWLVAKVLEISPDKLFVDDDLLPNPPDEDWRALQLALA